MHVYTCVYHRFLVFTYVYVYMNISGCIHVLYIFILVLSSFTIAQARWRRTLSSILSSLVWTSAPACVLCQGSTLFVTWHPSSRLGHAPQPLQRVKVNDDNCFFYYPTSTTSSAQPALSPLSQVEVRGEGSLRPRWGFPIHWLGCAAARANTQQENNNTESPPAQDTLSS